MGRWPCGLLSQYRYCDITVTWKGFEEVWRQSTRPHLGAHRPSHAPQHGKSQSDPRVPMALRAQMALAWVSGYGDAGLVF